MKITSILTPLIRREIPELLKWIHNSPPPCSAEDQKGLNWYLSIDNHWNPGEINTIRKHARNSALASMNLQFISIGLSAKESVYLRDLPPDATCDLEYGSKNGPNKQFFRSIEFIIDNSLVAAGDCTILLETDAIPLKPNWIQGLNSLLRDLPSFWIAGARYQGASPLEDAIKDHFNGNAVYGIGDPQFKDFVARWQAVLGICTQLRHWIAYDVAIPWIEYYLQSFKAQIPENQSSLIKRTVLDARSMSKDLSHAIVNSSGHYEVVNDHIDLSLYTSDVLIWHSRPLAKTIPWSLSPKGIDIEALKKEAWANRRIDAMRQSGILAYLEISDPDSFSPTIVDYAIETGIHFRDIAAQALYSTCLTLPRDEKDA
jgi:hypothetical protein